MVSLRLGDIAEFGFVSPPSPRAIADGLAELGELGAIVARPTGRRSSPPSGSPGPSADRPRPARMLVTARARVHGRRPGGRRGAIHPRRAVASGGQAEAADEAHRRFDEPGSDFLALLNLWDYAEEMRAELSGNQFRRRCEREFLHWTRLRGGVTCTVSCSAPSKIWVGRLNAVVSVTPTRSTRPSSRAFLEHRRAQVGLKGVPQGA